MNNQMLNEAVNSIVRDYQPEKIILFGSRARNDERLDSDYDFIIVKNTDERWIQRSLGIPSIPIHADFFVYTPKEFEEMKETSIFMTEALKQHIVLYDKNTSSKTQL